MNNNENEEYEELSYRDKVNLLNSINRPLGYSKHAIMDLDGKVYDHFTKESAIKRKERSRRKEKARRQARKANR